MRVNFDNSNFGGNSNLYPFKVIQGFRGHIDLGANRKRICNLLLVVNSNFGRICIIFEILTHKARKYIVFHTLYTLV